MQKPLAEHTAPVEQKIVKLKGELRNPSLARLRENEQEISLLNAQEALKVFATPTNSNSGYKSTSAIV